MALSEAHTVQDLKVHLALLQSLRWHLNVCLTLLEWGLKVHSALSEVHMAQGLKVHSALLEWGLKVHSPLFGVKVHLALLGQSLKVHFVQTKR